MACAGVFGLGVLGLLGKAETNAVDSVQGYETNAETQVIGRYAACRKVVNPETKRITGWQEGLEFKTNETFYFTARIDGKINGNLNFWLYDESGEVVKKYCNRQWHVYTREGIFAAQSIPANSLPAGGYTSTWYLNSTPLNSTKVKLSE